MGRQDTSLETLYAELEKDLQQRLSWMTPRDTVRGMILNGVLETVRELGDEAAVRQCLEVTGEKKFVDFFSYPFRTHLQLIYLAAKLLIARYGSFETALWNMGYQGAKNFLASPPGKLLVVTAQGDAWRLLNALPSAYAVGGSTLEPTVEWLGATTALFTLKRDFIPPPYTEGILQAVFEGAKVKGFQVRSRQPEPLVGEYNLTWE